jgi:hypothetical protein
LLVVVLFTADEVVVLIGIVGATGFVVVDFEVVVAFAVLVVLMTVVVTTTTDVVLDAGAS